MVEVCPVWEWMNCSPHTSIKAWKHKYGKDIISEPLGHIKNWRIAGVVLYEVGRSRWEGVGPFPNTIWIDGMIGWRAEASFTYDGYVASYTPGLWLHSTWLFLWFVWLFLTKIFVSGNYFRLLILVRNRGHVDQITPAGGAHEMWLT